MLSTTNSLGNKLITAYSLTAQTGPAVIDSTKHTVALSVYNGTDVTNLIATFTLSGGTSTQVGNTAQVSGTTSNNFTNSVIYKVSSADGSEQDWTVIVIASAAPTSEALTVSDPSTTGFTVALNPALNGLTASNFTLMDGSTPVTISSASTTDNGATYTIAATLAAGKIYLISATDTGYTFGTAQNSVVSSGASTSEALTVSNPSTTGYTVALNPALNGLTASDFTLMDGNTQMTISSASTTDNGATYTITATLTAGKTYTVTATKSDYDFGTAQNVVVSPGVLTSEALTVSNPSTTGFTVSLSPALNGLQTSDFILLDDQSQPVNISTATTTGSGITYTIAATLTAGKTYTVTATKTDYTFGSAQNVVVPTPPTSETLTVSNSSNSGFTVTLSPSLADLTGSDFTLLDGSTPVTISAASRADNGATYIIAATLTDGKTYTVTAADTGYTFGSAQNVVVPSAAATLSSAATTDGTHIALTMSSALTGSTGDLVAFTVSGVASSPTITNVAVSGTTVILTLGATIVNSDSSVMVSYTKTGNNDLTNGTPVANFSNQTVTNNVH